MFSNVFADQDWLEAAEDKAKFWDGDIENLQDWLHAQNDKET